MFQKVSTYILISIVLVWLSKFLNSEYLSEFLRENIVVIVITLLAINTATYGFLVSKIDEMSEGNDGSFFDDAIKQIRKSLKIQLILIAAAVFTLILANSEDVILHFNFHKEFFDGILTFIFILALDILRDTGFAVFELRKPK